MACCGFLQDDAKEDEQKEEQEDTSQSSTTSSQSSTSSTSSITSITPPLILLSKEEIALEKIMSIHLTADDQLLVGSKRPTTSDLAIGALYVACGLCRDESSLSGMPPFQLSLRTHGGLDALGKKKQKKKINAKNRM